MWIKWKERDMPSSQPSPMFLYSRERGSARGSVESLFQSSLWKMAEKRCVYLSTHFFWGGNWIHDDFVETMLEYSKNSRNISIYLFVFCSTQTTLGTKKSPKMKEICMGQIIFVLQWRWRDNVWEFPSGTIENCSVLSKNGGEKTQNPIPINMKITFPVTFWLLVGKSSGIRGRLWMLCVCARVFFSPVLLVAKNIRFIFFESDTLILRKAALDFRNFFLTIVSNPSTLGKSQ